MKQLMEKPWFEKYRPEKIEDVVFESEEVKQKIYSFIENGYVQGNLISYGPGGTGKTTINKILVHSIIKHQQDLFILGKSVNDVLELKKWLKAETFTSQQRIVVCEEFDQLSHEAQTQLKNGLMENFMPEVAFIVTTNNIHKLDNALLQRFNEKLNFTSYNIDGAFNRMKFILESENIKYNETDLYNLVKAFEHKGMRDLINNIQSGSINGVFSTQNLKNVVSTSQKEDTIINYIKYFTDVIFASQDLNVVYNLCCYPTKDPTIGKYYQAMLEWMDADPSINYEYIMRTMLEDENILLPIKKVITEYYQKLNLVPLPHIHLQSCIFEIFATLYSMQGGDRKLIH